MPVKSPIAWPNGKVYMFQGADYIRYDFRTGALDQAALPIAPTNWPMLRGTAPDAAFHLGFGKVYFFYGDEYVRFDIGLNTVEQEYLPPNLPTKIAGRWPGLPNDWATTKIDAAVNWGNGKVYFFRGSEYLRYDITFDRADPDYPKSIAGSWNGVWDADLDGVLYQGGTKAYFFKGNDYRRYDLDSDRVDESGSIDSLVLDLVPPGMWTAARDMTLDQANLVMGYLIESGKLVLRVSQNPYVGSWQTTITAPMPTARVAVQPAKINGIDFIYKDDATSALINNVDQRMLVALYRLTRWVNASKPDITVIRHLGIGAGNGPANDCHNQGRALDFSAIEGTLEGVAFVRQVKRDWGDKVVLPGVAVRLDAVADPLGNGLFRTVYRFGTFEGESNGIGVANKWPPKNVEDGKGYVIHPDYVDGAGESLRAHHQDHIHLQVGATRV
jgi:Hemopexin